MDRQATLLVALGLLGAASLVVAVSGFLLLARERRVHRAAPHTHSADADHPEAAEER